MNTFCQSCGAPVSGPSDAKYCTYCTDEQGNLKSREAVRAGIAAWLEQISPNDGTVDFQKRAESYMNAMPAWAES